MLPRCGVQHGEVSAPTGRLGRQGGRHGRPRAIVRGSGAEAVMRICRTPSRNPGDRLHVPTEQHLLFNGPIPRRGLSLRSRFLFLKNVAISAILNIGPCSESARQKAWDVT